MASLSSGRWAYLFRGMELLASVGRVGEVAPRGSGTRARAVAVSAVTLGYTALKLYWATGGRGLRGTVGFAPEVWEEPAFVLLGLWGTVVLGLAVVVVAWSLARPPGWLPASLYRVLRAVVWGACLVLLARAALGLIGGGIAVAGSLGDGGPSRALVWNLLVYSPYFLVWALLWAALAAAASGGTPRDAPDAGGR